MNVKKIGVIGAGQMGHGIALVSAQAGSEVVLHDINNDYVQKGLSKIERFLDKGIEKGKITKEDKEKIKNKIKGTTKLQDIKDMDLVIEAIYENMKVKKELFKELDNICKKDCILASNTSTIPIQILHQ